MGKVLGNVGVLDLTNASEESISGIDSIDNVGLLLYSEDTAKLIQRLNTQNLGLSLKVPKDCGLVQGQIEMDSQYLKGIKEPLSLCIMGQLVIKPDVMEEDLERAIKEITVSGQIICPERLTGIIQSKCGKSMGKVLRYSSNYSIKMGNLNMNNQFLSSIDKPISIAIMGVVSLMDDMDMDLLDEKIEGIDVMGKVLIREEYLNLFNKKAHSMDQCTIQIIPKGYVYFTEDLYLDPINIKKLNNIRIYSEGLISFDPNITKELLEGHIEKIESKDAIVCTRALKEAVLGLCGDVSTRICDYTGRVLIIDGERKLTQSELKYTPGPITYIVKGDFLIDDNVLPETFMEKVEYIDNFGDITCDTEHYGLIQSKLRISEGDITDRGGFDKANIGVLKL